MNRNITLIGLPTSGKSRLGEILSKDYSYEQVDGDRDILIPEIGKLQKYIKKFGEKAFLDIEQKLFLDYLFFPYDQVISPGGSVVYSDIVMQKLKQISKVCYLKIDFDYFKKNEKELKNRGVIRLENRSLEEFYLERCTLCEKYQDFTFDTTLGDFEKIAKEIIRSV